MTWESSLVFVEMLSIGWEGWPFFFFFFFLAYIPVQGRGYPASNIAVWILHRRLGLVGKTEPDWSCVLY